MKKNRKCLICEKPHYGKGYCQHHYWNLYKNGDPLKSIRPRRYDPSETCRIEGCTNKIYGHYLCSKHYQRWETHGDPHKTLTNRGAPWINKNGYVITYVDGKECLTHRLVMEKHIGRPLKKHEYVHHIDEDKTNNNIENLEIVTPGVHSMDRHPLERNFLGQFMKRIKN